MRSPRSLTVSAAWCMAPRYGSSGMAASLLPYAAHRTGVRQPGQVRLVLTGPGGGTWDVGIAGANPPGPREMSIVTDVVGFCRLVARRVGPAELELHVTGDPDQAARVLTAAASLALD